MKLNGLSQFLAVCATRNLTAAAKMLGVSQPALTQAIGKLERQLDVTLFDRSTRPLNLTAYGSALFDYATRLEQSTDDLIDKFEAMKSGSGGLLRVGCGPDWVHEVMPLAIPRLQDAHPQLRVNLNVALNDDLRKSLDAGEIELFFASISDVYLGSAYRTQILVRQRMHIVARRDHPMIDGRPHSLDEVSAAQWAMTGEETFGRQLARRLFSQWGADLPLPSVETNSVPALINILHNSQKLGFLSRAHADAFPNIAIVETDFDMPMREGGVVWRSDRPLLPAAENLLEHVRQLVKLHPH
ncbi:LysR family transcriptional regulator [Sulfitobacter sp. D35]|uniref:LysR family transcriptional regulator n=1 Tax=Sulfitobacter sp. D35 TaxID=3083252 RepID=UPI00296F3C03|nr:LysR family transcriptional regulator [Sulfitobacter sp. D35]MDW4497192.1 LysR family transcriptional regulator [Sulfitobacter sp. D35]